MEIAPFSFKCSPNIASLLQELCCTIAISTYQAGKIIFIGSYDGLQVTQMARNFQKPMGIALKDDKMAIATLDGVLVLKNEPQLAEHYPPNPGIYDTLYVPRISYHTGMLDIHDISWGNKGLWAINTQFSCLSLISSDYSFDPIWQPNFINELSPHDRCHLNGLAMLDGEPIYVTALGTGSEPESWRANKAKGGALMHIPSNSIIADQLPMPHSPRVYDGKIYVLFSATGQLATIDHQTGEITILANLGGLVRGMSRLNNYLFIGLSKIRKTSRGFENLPISKTADKAGVLIFDLKKQMVVGSIVYLRSVDEIYDVQVLAQVQRPGIITPEKEAARYAVTSPEFSFWKIPKENKK